MVRLLSIVKKKKKVPEPEYNVKKRFRNVKVLIQTDRPKEAIAYIYNTYVNCIHLKHKKPRLPYQTIREYAIICVNELGHKPESVYPFVSSVENIIYGGMEPTIEQVNRTSALFSTLYKEITNKTFSFSL